LAVAVGGSVVIDGLSGDWRDMGCRGGACQGCR